MAEVKPGVVDTTTLRNEKWRTSLPADKVPPPSNEVIVLKPAKVTITGPTSEDGFRHIIHIDDKDFHEQMRKAEKRIEVKTETGKASVVTVLCGDGSVVRLEPQKLLRIETGRSVIEFNYPPTGMMMSFRVDGHEVYTFIPKLMLLNFEEGEPVTIDCVLFLPRGEKSR